MELIWTEICALKLILHSYPFQSHFVWVFNPFPIHPLTFNGEMKFDFLGCFNVCCQFYFWLIISISYVMYPVSFIEIGHSHRWRFPCKTVLRTNYSAVWYYRYDKWKQNFCAFFHCAFFRWASPVVLYSRQWHRAHVHRDNIGGGLKRRSFSNLLLTFKLSLDQWSHLTARHCHHFYK